MAANLFIPGGSWFFFGVSEGACGFLVVSWGFPGFLGFLEFSYGFPWGFQRVPWGFLEVSLWVPGGFLGGSLGLPGNFLGATWGFLWDNFDVPHIM